MGKIVDFLSQTKVVKEVTSPINGKISVIRSIGFGTYIQVSNLTQSGGILRDVWKKTLKKILKDGGDFKRCLVLGLGGGTVVRLLKRYWPRISVVGVDIDPIMVEMGKRYLDFKDASVHIEDAWIFVERDIKKKVKYDMVLVDTYVGDSFPKKLESRDFVNNVKKVTRRDGVIVFNRLYYDEKRKEAVQFGKVLEEEFARVDVVYPEANIMFVCYQNEKN